MRWNPQNATHRGRGRDMQMCSARRRSPSLCTWNVVMLVAIISTRPIVMCDLVRRNLVSVDRRKRS